LNAGGNFAMSVDLLLAPGTAKIVV